MLLRIDVRGCLWAERRGWFELGASAAGRFFAEGGDFIGDDDRRGQWGRPKLRPANCSTLPDEMGSRNRAAADRGETVCR